ncbi:MAG: hypothetical protein AAFV62_09360, partial [Pseudomonadota bacterium]
MTAEPSGFSARRLFALVTGFMAARGFAGAESAPGIWLGHKGEGEQEQLGAVLVPSRLGVAGVDVDWAVDAMTTLQGKGAQGRIPIVVTSRRGLSSDDMKRLVAAGGSVLFPIQFIDWYFRRDQSGEGDEGASRIDDKLRRMVDQDLIRTRAPQPFRYLRDLSANPADEAPVADGSDLFKTLFDALTEPVEKPKLRVICGHAGVGKTVLVNVLVDRLRTAFNEAKAANRPGLRPLFFSPE